MFHAKIYKIYTTSLLSGVGELYKPRRTVTSNEEGDVPMCVQDNRFDNCHPLRFTCHNEDCKTEIEIKTVITDFVRLSENQPFTT